MMLYKLLLTIFSNFLKENLLRGLLNKIEIIILQIIVLNDVMDLAIGCLYLIWLRIWLIDDLLHLIIFNDLIWLRQLNHLQFDTFQKVHNNLNISTHFMVEVKAEKNSIKFFDIYRTIFQIQMLQLIHILYDSDVLRHCLQN